MKTRLLVPLLLLLLGGGATVWWFTRETQVERWQRLSAEGDGTAALAYAQYLQQSPSPDPLTLEAAYARATELKAPGAAATWLQLLQQRQASDPELFPAHSALAALQAPDSLYWLWEHGGRTDDALLEQAAALRNPDALFARFERDRARAEAGEGTLFEAYRLLLQAGTAGHREAQFLLGEHYTSGGALGQDPQLGLEWYLKAARQGHVQASLIVGIAYARRPLSRDAREGEVYLTYAWEQGMVEGLFQLGDLHRREEKDIGLEELEKAAHLGSAPAMRSLVNAYGRRQTRWRDVHLGVTWLQRFKATGAEDSLTDAVILDRAVEPADKAIIDWHHHRLDLRQRQTRALYAGEPDPLSPEEKALLSFPSLRERLASAGDFEAALRGDVDATVALAKALDGGTLTPYSRTESLNWWRSAAVRGSAEAAYVLYERIQQGQAESLDANMAQMYLGMAVTRNYPPAIRREIEAIQRGELKIGNPERVIVSMLLRADANGDPEALEAVRNYFRRGEGVDLTQTRHRELIQELAEAGEAAPARYWGLFLLLSLPEEKEALAAQRERGGNFLLQAADAGDVSAQSLVAYLGTQRRIEAHPEVARLYRQLRQERVVSATSRTLSAALAEYKALRDRAPAHLEAAANAGDRHALYLRAGYHFAGGWGFARDLYACTRDLRAAAEAGHSEARLVFTDLVQASSDEAEKPEEEVADQEDPAPAEAAASSQQRYFLADLVYRAETLEEPQAMVDLAEYLLRDRSPFHDPEEALNWLETAAEQDYIPAYKTLAVIYKQGEDVDADPMRSLRWLTGAADMGDSESQYVVGLIYAQGEIAVQDFAKARHYFALAAAQGNALAAQYLENLKTDQRTRNLQDQPEGEIKPLSLWATNTLARERFSIRPHLVWEGRLYPVVDVTRGRPVIDVEGRRRTLPAESRVVLLTGEAFAKGYVNFPELGYIGPSMEIGGVRFYNLPIEPQLVGLAESEDNIRKVFAALVLLTANKPTVYWDYMGDLPAGREKKVRIELADYTPSDKAEYHFYLFTADGEVPTSARTQCIYEGSEADQKFAELRAKTLAERSADYHPPVLHSKIDFVHISSDGRHEIEVRVGVDRAGRVSAIDILSPLPKGDLEYLYQFVSRLRFLPASEAGEAIPGTATVTVPVL